MSFLVKDALRERWPGLDTVARLLSVIIIHIMAPDRG